MATNQTISISNVGSEAVRDRDVLVRYMNEALIAEEIWDYNEYAHDVLRDVPKIITLSKGHGIRRLTEEILVEAANSGATELLGVKVEEPWELKAEDPLAWASPALVHAAFIEATRRQMGAEIADGVNARRKTERMLRDSNGNISGWENSVDFIAQNFIYDARIKDARGAYTIDPEALRAGEALSDLPSNTAIELSPFDPRYRSTAVGEVALRKAQRTFMTLDPDRRAPRIESLATPNAGLGGTRLVMSKEARQGGFDDFSSLVSTTGRFTRSGDAIYEAPVSSSLDLIGFRRLYKFGPLSESEENGLERAWGRYFSDREDAWYTTEYNEETGEMVRSQKATPAQVREAKARMDSIVEALEKLKDDGFAITMSIDEQGWVQANYERGCVSGKVNVIHSKGADFENERANKLSHMGQLYSDGVTYNIALEDQKLFNGNIDTSKYKTVDGRSSIEVGRERSLSIKRQGPDVFVDGFGTDTQSLVVSGETMYQAMLLSMGLQPKVEITQEMIDAFAFEENGVRYPGLIDEDGEELAPGEYTLGDATIQKRVAGMKNTYVPLSYRNKIENVFGRTKIGETISLVSPVSSISVKPGSKSFTADTRDIASVSLISHRNNNSRGKHAEIISPFSGATYIKRAIIEARHNYRAELDLQKSVFDPYVASKNNGEKDEEITFVPSTAEETRAMQGRIWSFLKTGKDMPQFGEKNTPYYVKEVEFEEFASAFVDTQADEATQQAQREEALQKYTLWLGNPDWENNRLRLSYLPWCDMNGLTDSDETRMAFAEIYVNEAVDTLVGVVRYGQDERLGDLRGEIVGEEYYSLNAYSVKDEALADDLSRGGVAYEESDYFLLKERDFVDLSTATFSADFVSKFAGMGNFAYNHYDMVDALRYCNEFYVDNYVAEKDKDRVEVFDLNLVQASNKVGERERLLDGVLWFDEFNAQDISQSDNAFLVDVGQTIHNTLASCGVVPGEILVDKNGIVRWSGEIVSSIAAKDGINMLLEEEPYVIQEIKGTIGPVFAFDEDSRTFDVRFNASPDFVLSVGYKGCFLDSETHPDYGDRFYRTCLIDELTTIKNRISHIVRGDAMNVFTNELGKSDAADIKNLGSPISLRGLWRNEVDGERVLTEATEAQLVCGIDQELIDARAKDCIVSFEQYEEANPSAGIGNNVDYDTGMKSLAECMGYDTINEAGNSIINILTAGEASAFDSNNVQKNADQGVKRVLGTHIEVDKDGFIHNTAQGIPEPGSWMISDFEGNLYPSAQCYVQKYWTKNHASIAVESEVEAIVERFVSDFAKTDEKEDAAVKKNRLSAGLDASAEAVWEVFEQRYGKGFSEMSAEQWKDNFRYNPNAWVLSMDAAFDTWNETMIAATDCNVVDQWLRGALQVNILKECIGIVDDVQVAFCEVEGFNQDDAVVISREFAERARISDEFCDPVLDADGNAVIDPATGKALRQTRPLQVGDKISDGHGNKGVISAIVDREKSLDEYTDASERRRAQLFVDNSGLEITMSPFSSISRENYGSVLEAAGGVSDLVLREYARDEFGKVDPSDSGVSYVRENGIGTISITVTEHTGPSGVKLYPYGVGRQIGWQAKTCLESIAAYAVLTEMCGNANAGFKIMRDAWRVMGVDFDKDGTVKFCEEFEPKGLTIVSLLEPAIVHGGDWSDGKVPHQSNDQASISKRCKNAKVAAEAALSSLGGKSGYIALPFELKNKGIPVKNKYQGEGYAPDNSYDEKANLRYGHYTSTLKTVDVDGNEANMLYVSGAASRRNEDAEEAAGMLDEVSGHYQTIEYNAYMYSDAKTRIDNVMAAFEVASDEAIARWCLNPYVARGKDNDPEVSALTDAVLLNIGSLPYKASDFTNYLGGRSAGKTVVTTEDVANATAKQKDVARNMLNFVFGRDANVDTSGDVFARRSGLGEGGKLNELLFSMESCHVKSQRAWDKVQEYYDTRLTENKNLIKQNFIKSRAPGLSATAVWVPDPTLSLDEVGVPAHIAEEMNLNEGEDVLVWRDPCIRNETLCNLKVHIYPEDFEASSIAVHPAMSAYIGGDFDGDKAGMKKFVSKEARVESAEKLNPARFLLDDESPRVDAEGSPNGYNLKLSGDGLDMAVALASDKALQNRFDDICDRANALDPKSEDYYTQTDAIMRDLNELWHDGLAGQIGQAAVQFGDRAEILASQFGACVATGAKGKLSKLLSGVQTYMGLTFKEGVDPEQVLSEAYANRLMGESAQIAMNDKSLLDTSDKADFVRYRLTQYKNAQPNNETLAHVLELDDKELYRRAKEMTKRGAASQCVRDVVEESLDVRATFDDIASGMTAKVYQSALTGQAGVPLQKSVARCGDNERLSLACHKLFANVNQKTLDWKKNGKEACEQAALLTKTLVGIINGEAIVYGGEDEGWQALDTRGMSPDVAEKQLSLIFDQLEIAYNQEDMHIFTHEFSARREDVMRCFADDDPNEIVFYGLKQSEEVDTLLDKNFGENGMMRLMVSRSADVVLRAAANNLKFFEGKYSSCLMPGANKAAASTEKSELGETQKWVNVLSSGKQTNVRFNAVKSVNFKYNPDVLPMLGDVTFDAKAEEVFKRLLDERISVLEDQNGAKFSPRPFLRKGHVRNNSVYVSPTVIHGDVLPEGEMERIVQATVDVIQAEQGKQSWVEAAMVAKEMVPECKKLGNDLMKSIEDSLNNTVVVAPVPAKEAVRFDYGAEGTNESTKVVGDVLEDVSNDVSDDDLSF